ncbi:MAG: glycosyltransferase [Nocardioidaceae bacterium]|nr:glycosyltransferase [Nocardioidaceae bacterium]
MGILMIVPTLGRRPDLLRLCLDSIASQQVGDIDIVLVAPPGTGVEAVAEQYEARFVADPGRGGLSGALNAGLAAARPGTTYAAWLGDDDLLSLGSLQRTTSLLDQRPDAVMAFGWCDYIDERGEVVFRSRAGRLAAWILGWGPNLVPQPGSLMRYDAVMAVGALDESVRLAMDLDLFLRLRRRGRLVAIPATLASFRWHADSATVQGESVSMEESDRLRMRYMHPLAARAYLVLRWPGRLALWLAKRRVDRNSAAVARAR